MYEEFYGFRERPFSLLPDPDFLYLSKKHDAALTLLNYSLTNANVLSVISGEVGTGKTTLIRHLLNHLGKDITVGLITNTHPAFEDLLQWILLAFDLSSQGKSKLERHHIFSDFLKREHARNRRAVLVIDEAQNMSSACLSELVLLSNVSAGYNQVLQVVLVGQSGLREILRQPELENARQRIGMDYHLEPLNRVETHYYILHRLKVAGGKDPGLFSAEARDTIFRYSGGIPRLINLLCETALVYGFSEQKRTIDTALIEAVACDKKAGGIVPLQDKLWDGPTGPPLTPVFSAVDSVTQPSPAAGAQESKPVTGSTDPVAEEASHAMPVQTPMPMPSNRTTALASRPTSPRSGKARQVVLYLGLALAAGLLGSYQLLEQESELFTPRVSRSTPSASESRAADQSLTTGQINHPEKEDQRSAVASRLPDEERSAVETANMGVAAETAPTEAPVEPQVIATKTLSSTSTIPGEELGGTGAAKPTITVKAGDTLMHIIRQVYGRYDETILEAILRNNPEIRNPDLIKVGQVIRLPR